MNRKIKDILIRYSVATLGLALVAVGVSLSISSNLGTSPISCPPYVMALWGGLTVGEYTALMHLIFIILQIILLRKQFKAVHLLQIVAAVVFGGLTDLAIWALSWLSGAGLAGKTILMVLSCLVTALGVSIEVRAKAWMLAGEMTVSAISQVSGMKFRNVKIAFDVCLVVIAAVISWSLFGNPLGKTEGATLMESLLAQADGVVIGIGTLVSALCTGLIMKVTDPVTERLFGKIIG